MGVAVFVNSSSTTVLWLLLFNLTPKGIEEVCPVCRNEKDQWLARIL